jgi:prepilin signal peptidase PulO-like enzyme (type II secretory pathway)
MVSVFENSNYYEIIHYWRSSQNHPIANLIFYSYIQMESIVFTQNYDNQCYCPILFWYTIKSYFLKKQFPFWCFLFFNHQIIGFFGFFLIIFLHSIHYLPPHLPSDCSPSHTFYPNPCLQVDVPSLTPPDL